jgi:DNA-binding XRE family transcriptional regulator
MDRKRINEIYKAIGKEIRRFREERQLTQQQLAESSELTRTSVVHIEKGEQRIPIDRLYRIAEALNVQIMDILPINTKSEQLDLLSKNRVNKTQFSKIEKLFEGVNHELKKKSDS